MKNSLKLLALLFLLFCMFGSGSNAFALSADRPTTGNLIIHKFLGDKTDLPNDGTEVTNMPTDRIPLSGVQFGVYEIKAPADESTPYPPPGNLGQSDADKWSYSHSGLILYVTGRGANEPYAYAYTLVEVAKPVTVDGVATITDLNGYYYVEENVAASNPKDPAGKDVVIVSGIDSFIVSMPLRNKTGDAWLTTVNVYPKNQDLKPDKKPETPSVAIGEEFNWYVTANIPDNFTSMNYGKINYTKFDIWDQFDYRLDYLDVPSVEGGMTQCDGKWVTKIELVADGDYMVLPQTGDLTADPPIGTKVTVRLKPEGINKLGTNADVEQIRVSFRTKANQYVEGTGIINNAIPNEATIEFYNKHGDGSDKTPEVKVLYGSIAVDKIDDHGATLPESEFQLADTDENAANKQYLKVTLTNEGGIATILKAGDFGYEDALPWIIKPGEMDKAELGGQTTNAGRTVYYSESFRGLRIGEANLATPPDIAYYSYWLVETQAPAGFNLLEEPLKVTFSATTPNQLITQKVINKRGFTLPETGSLVTILLVVLGISLVGFAAIMMIVKRKNS